VEEEFWQLINPEINDLVPIDDFISTLRIMIEICILQRMATLTAESVTTP